jgi:protease IV
MRKPLRFFSVVLASLLGSIIAVGLLFFFTLVFVALMSAGSGSSAPVVSNSVLVMDLEGNLPEIVSKDPFAQAFRNESPFGLYDVIRALDRAATDDRIKALWLRTGNVSMSWASLQSLRRQLELFRKSGKPVIASGKSFAMSEKAYFLASTADSIYSDPESMFEMNGFAVSVEYYKKLLDKINVRPQVVRAGTFKSAVEPYLREDISPANRKQLQSLIDDIDDVFVSTIASARSIKASALVDILDNRSILMARDARKAGLLDGLLFEDQVRDVLSELLGNESSEDLRETTLRAYVAGSANSGSGGSGEIGVVYAVGAITGGESSDTPNPFLGSTSVGSDTFAKAIRRARKSKRTKAIVVRINSPGGFAPAADAMLREIQLTALEKPVVISMGDVAASGGYWIATGAGTIVAEPLTITGSIGVFSLFFDVSGLFSDHLGITYGTIKSHPQADMFSGLRAYSSSERSVLQASTDATYQSFLKKVSESRQMDITDVDRIAQGRIWTGRAALDIGLVDTLGGLNTAISLAAEAVGLDPANVRIRSWPKPPTFFETFSKMMGAGYTWIRDMATTRVRETGLRSQFLRLIRVMGANGSVQALMPIRFAID